VIFFEIFSGMGFAGQKAEGIDELHRLLTYEKVGIKQRIVVIRKTEKLVFEVFP